MDGENHGPLKGLRLTEFTTAWAGPYASCLLALLGMEVIKVETRGWVDHTRARSFSTGRYFTNPDESDVFNNLNLNKKSVTLNLKKPRAVEIAKGLAAVSDVIVENMRPGVMERLGLDYESLRQVKPDIIYLSSSSCGQRGPEREYVGYAPTFAALGGVSLNTGYEDGPPSAILGVIDLRSATTAAAAILAALFYHQRTRRGQHIDLASQEAITMLNGEALMDYLLNNRVRTRRGNKDDVMAPHNCYPCVGNDNWISIAVADDKEWQALCRAMDRPELVNDPRFAEQQARLRNQIELDEIITEWTREQDYYHVMELLQGVGVAATPSLSAKALFNDAHIKEREVFRQVEHPVLGQNWVLAPAWRLSETPAAIQRHGPLMGEHNEDIFQGLLGLTSEEIETLKEQEVIY
ncbi:MAG: CoA transferase [Syntrophobacteraceae bacterium]|jgi:benzylsuccinate CoA-transferase BbsF subunit